MQHYTFYDFIVNKARGKSGPLFNFDVHDDVRMIHDASKEKDEVGYEGDVDEIALRTQSHAGKVVERSWYNRFKHIFPASRWEVSYSRERCKPELIDPDIRSGEKLWVICESILSSGPGRCLTLQRIS